MKWIGITPARANNNGRDTITVNRDYMDAVLRAGALPVLLPLTEDKDVLNEAFSHLNGLLLTGGADVSPWVYGEEKLPLCGECEEARDKMESALLHLALKRDMPVFCICRGMQMLNCVLGGTLYQDIAQQFSEILKHPCYDVPATQVHTVSVTPESLLYQITSLTTLHVNSRHHQGVKTLGQGLRVCAKAPDGLIEGIELPGKKFVLGVQWHPETLSSAVADAQMLFDAFVSAC